MRVYASLILGAKNMKKKLTTVEKRAALIIKYRKLKVRKKEREGDRIIISLSRGDVKYVLLCVTGQRNIGIAYVRELKELVEKTGAEKGIIVSDVKYTWSARTNAPKMCIELIPSTLPTFDIFKHRLVSPAEIVSEEEREQLLIIYHAAPFQFPWIKASDPVCIVLGANRGNIIKFTIDSMTAGTSISYRYVV